MSGAAYYKDLDLLSDEVLEYNDKWQRHRLRALQSIDEMVGDLVQKLSDANALDNTYVIFTSDNGYHLSQHRMFAGKNCGLETDINVPFFVRGPGIEAGSTDSTVGSHVDISPTIMELVGEAQRDEFDGGILSMGGATDSQYSEHITVEHWGRGIVEGKFGAYGTAGSAGRDYKNNTFRSIRLIGSDFSFYYSVWCNGDHELYDMTVSVAAPRCASDLQFSGANQSLQNDPGQIHNLYEEDDAASAFKFKGRGFQQVASRLDTLLMVMKSCTGDECRHPYASIFPSGEATTLGQSMAEQFDSFFSNQPNVKWDECTLGYIKELEGPINANVYQGSSKSRIKRGDEWKYETGWSLHI
jgi:N-acetylglucosamine-6-sulfatase